MPRTRALLLVAVLSPGALALGAPRKIARAASQPGCRAPTATGTAPSDLAWERAFETLVRDLAAAPGGCNGVVVTLAWESGGARLLARTPDGLTTSRVVTAPGALSAVAFGLLAAAPVERAPPAVDPRDLPPPEAPTFRPVAPPSRSISSRESP